MSAEQVSLAGRRRTQKLRGRGLNGGPAARERWAEADRAEPAIFDMAIDGDRWRGPEGGIFS